MSEVSRLLRLMVLGSEAERAGALHDAALLRQADGTVHQGRERILAVFSQRPDGSRYLILSTTETSVRVALELADVPGQIVFVLRGEVVAGRLIAVHVEL